MGDSLKTTLAPVVVQTMKTLVDSAINELTRTIARNEPAGTPVSHEEAARLLAAELTERSGEVPASAPGGSWLDEGAKVVTILIGGQQRAVELSETALQRARLNFNPSGLEDVIKVKALVAALYAILEPLTAERGTQAREAATAMTQLQAGAMFAVSAITAP